MQAFPFNSEFQRKVVKLALLDDGFATMCFRYITADMFESESLRWVWRQVLREREDGRRATLLVVRDRVRDVSAEKQPRLNTLLDMIDRDLMREDAFIRLRLAEFIKRNMFVAAYNASQLVYNSGRHDEAMRLMYEASLGIQQVTFDAPDRGWFYDELDDRLALYRDYGEREWEFAHPTGIHGVDLVLDGGLTLGELGVWIADSKGGKSMLLRFLASHTARALGRNVLVIILEGRRRQYEAQLDTLHAKIFYRDMKRGVVDREVYQQMQAEYRMLRGRMVIRAFTKDWNYNAGDIRNELDELRTVHGWVPHQLVVDYGDLLRSQGKARSEEEHQRDAFADLKVISTQDQGYSVWTASQTQRPPKEVWDKEEKGKEPKRKWGKFVWRARDIADSYNKIRRADFIGSINQDEEDKQKNLARLYCDRYRDNEADRLVYVKQMLDKMTFVDLLDPLNRPDMASKVRAEVEAKLGVPSGEAPADPQVQL